MCKFDEEMKPYYERYHKAFENNDIKEIAYLSQFSDEKDIREWWERQVCENMHTYDRMKSYGYTEIILNDNGWLEWKFKDYMDQEFVPLGEVINRGCCNMKENMAIAVKQVPNGKWVAEVSNDFTSIGHSYIYLGVGLDMFDTRTEAWNNALKEFIERWRGRNPNVKKDDKAVAKAKSLIIVQGDFFEHTSLPKGEVVQLELFTF